MQRRMAVSHYVSGRIIGPIFNSQAVKFLDFFTFDDGTDSLSRNVGNKLPFHAT